MGSMFGGSDTTKTTSEPWKKAQPYLEQGFKFGGDLLNQTQANPQAYAGPRVAGFSQPSQMGLNATVGNALQGSPIAGNAMGALNSVTSNMGVSDPMLNATQGANAVATGQIGANSIGNNLSGVAQGQNLGQMNPALQQAIQGQMGSAMDRINAELSARGRSGASTNLASRAGQALGSIGINAAAQNYENEANRMMQANQMMSGEQLANIGNMTNAGMGLAGMFGDAQSRALQGAALAPALDQMRFTDADALMRAGSAYDTQQQQTLDAMRSQYEENRDIPWQRFQQFGNTIGGVASPYGTQTQTQPGQSPISSAIGGGIAGLGMFGGPLGMLGGAGLGLLGGL